MSGSGCARRPRVLLVAAGSSTTGGGEKHVADLVRGLPKAGFDVAVVCPGGGDLGDLARGLGLPVCNEPIDSGFSPERLRAVRAAIIAAAPDVVHAHGSRAAAFARLADPQARRRVVYTVHGIHVDRAGSAARRIVFTGIERLLRPRTARFITVCHSDTVKGARLGLLTAARAATIHNGIELPQSAAARGRFRAELGVGPDVPLVLSVGRFHEQKDQETLLHAWRDVARAHSGAVLAIVGSGDLENQLRAVTAADGTSGSVRLVGPRAALAEAYVDADVFALSSRWEGLPYVILEAMAHGLPVVSTGVDGIPEAVVDGVTGLLVPPRDPVALATALEQLLSDPAQRRRLGEAGRERVTAEFSLEQMVARISDVYLELAGLLSELPRLRFSGSLPGPGGFISNRRQRVSFTPAMTPAGMMPFEATSPSVLPPSQPAQHAQVKPIEIYGALRASNDAGLRYRQVLTSSSEGAPVPTPALVAGMVMLYRPTADVLDNVRTSADQVRALYAVDNTEDPDPSFVSALETISEVRYLPNARNLGVATALNIGSRRAIEDGYEWLLTMDQDSTPTPGMVASMLRCLSLPRAQHIGLISPFHTQVGGNPRKPQGPYTEVLTAMTSGNLLRLSAYAAVGPFLDDLFIDQVDNEFCLRLHAAGFTVLEAGEAVLAHRVGSLHYHRLPLPMYTSNHAPVRRYYITRNRFYVGRMYRDRFPEYRRFELRQLAKEVLKILLYERQKLPKLRMMGLGFRDYRRGRLGPYSPRS